MPSIFSRFILSPEDVGIEHYSVQEIAEMMKPVEYIDDASLQAFAHTVSRFLEEDSSVLEECKSDNSFCTNKVTNV